MKSPSFVRLSVVAVRILGYLSAHRDAQDTVEGIAEWWLLERRIRHVITEVKQALDELVTQKMVLERKGLDGRVYYRLSPRKHRTVAHLLSEAPLGSPDVARDSTAGETGGRR